MLAGDMPRSRLVQRSRSLGFLGLLGCLSVVLTDIAAVMVHDTAGFVENTISDLAAGRHAWIQDIGLYLFSLGMLAVAWGLHRWRLDGRRWWLGTLLLGLIAVIIIVMGAYGEYGDREPGGPVIHDYLVYAVGIGFAAVALLLVPGFRRLHPAWARFSLVVAVLWILAAPVLFWVPTAWDGLYERAVGLLMLGWLAGISLLLIRWDGRPGEPSADKARPGR